MTNVGMIKLAEFVFKWLPIYQTVYFHQKVFWAFVLPPNLFPPFLCLKDFYHLGKKNSILLQESQIDKISLLVSLFS